MQDKLYLQTLWRWSDPSVSCRLPPVFANLEQFSLDRFAVLDREDKQHHYPVIAFGGREDRFMGKHFTTLPFKSIWAVLTDRFDFGLDSSFFSPVGGRRITVPVNLVSSVTDVASKPSNVR